MSLHEMVVFLSVINSIKADTWTQERCSKKKNIQSFTFLSQGITMIQRRQNSRQSPKGLYLTVVTASAELDEQGSFDFIV